MRRGALNRFVLALALTTMLVKAAGCTAPSEATPHDETHGGTVDRAGVASCDPDNSRDQIVKARKERIARGVFYASRRLEVDHDLELWDTPYGRFWVVAGNFRTFAEVLAEQAVNIYGDESNGVRSGDVVLDGGAHFGGFTRTALNRGAKLVVAVEIAPENARCLRRNFAAEIASGRVVVYEKGVWNSDGSMVLERRNNTWADHVVESGPGPTVAVTTIDKIVSELGLAKVDFIKLDIEGAERNALAGATATLLSHRPRMAIASYHEPDDVAVLSKVVLGAQPAYDVCLKGGSLGHGYMTLLFH
jgi:FkbM family methyltransferase